MKESNVLSIFTDASKKFNGRKICILVCVLLITIVDAIVLVSLGLQNYSGVHFICPIVMLCVDALYLVTAIFSNYRLKYTIRDAILYIVAVVGILAAVLVMQMGVLGTFIFTTVAGIMWLAIHVLACLALILTMAFATRAGKKVFLVLACAVCIIFIAASGLYTFNVVKTGVWGQGTGENRPIAYSYDGDTDSYIVANVLKGNGDTVTIPDTFNGKAVSGIDCEVFSTEGVNKVVLNGGEVTFHSLENLQSINTGLEIIAPKTVLDEHKQYFHQLASTSVNSAAIHNLANSFTPALENEAQTYIVFNYDQESYNAVDGKILPTWYGQLGDQFSWTEYCQDNEDIEYILHSDKTNEEDLRWNYTNFNRLIVNAPLAEGDVVDGSVKSVDITFDNVYQLEITEDNDDLYTVPETLRYLDQAQDELYRYATLNGVEEILAEMPSRDGFSIGWTYSVNGSAAQDFTSKDDIADLKGSIEFIPNWTIAQPEFTLTTNSANNSYVYGDDVEITTALTNEVESLSYKYEWDRNGVIDSLETGTSYDVNKADPTDTAVYGLKVTVYSDTVTSLSATYKKTVNIVVDKKELSFTWNIPTGADLVYSGSDKSISANVDVANVVGDDVIDYDWTEKTVKNVGNYTSVITLNGTTADNYRVKATDAQRTVIITPYALTVVWTNPGYTYDKTEQGPHAAANGIGSDGTLELTHVNNSNVNAGSYQASVSITDDTLKTNYAITNATCDYVIDKQSITVESWDTTALTYNGQPQLPTPLSFAGLISGDSIDESNVNVIGKTGNVNAGNHTVEATLNNANYEFSTAQTYIYDIAKKEITILWSSTTALEYSGQAQGVQVVGIQDAVSGQETSIVGDLTVAGQEINARTEAYTMTAILTGGSQSEINYLVVAGASCAYNINKRVIAITNWSYSTTVYNGTVQTPAPTAYSNVVSGEESTVSSLITVDAAATGSKNVGQHTVVAVINTNGNYEFSSEAGDESDYTTTYTISAKTLTVVWNATREFKYDGTEKSVTPQIQGFANGETIDTPNVGITVSGAETTVGDHTMTIALEDGCNYAIATNQKTCDYAITAIELTINWNASNSYTYTGAQINPTYTVDVEEGYDYLSGDTEANVLTFSIPTSVNASATPYTATVSLKSGKEYYVIKTGASHKYYVTAKELTVSLINDEFEYTASAVTLEYDVQGLVSADEGNVNNVLSLITTGATNVKAGGYTVAVALKSGVVNYTLAAGSTSLSYDITPVELTVTLDVTTYAYVGAPVALQYNVVGLKGADQEETVLTFATGETNVNAAGYDAAVALKSGVVNYTLASGSESLHYIITPAELTVTLEETSYAYTGTAVALAYDVQGLKGSDAKEAILNLSEGQINVGTGYVATATLKTANGNYTLAGGEVLIYNITAIEITLGWQETTNLTYNGNLQGIEVVSITGIVDADDEETILNSLIYDGKQTDASGEDYTMTASLPSESNYVISSGSTCLYSIAKATVTVDLATTSYEYTGSPVELVYQVQGLQGGDTNDEILNLTQQGETNVAEGLAMPTVTLKDDDGNYTLAVGDNATYAITAKAITLNWTEGSDVLASGYPQAEIVESLTNPPTITYTFAVKGSSDFSDIAPVEDGEYTVRATVLDGNFAVTAIEKDYQIVTEEV